MTWREYLAGPAHTYDAAMVTVIRKANLEKNLRMQSHRMEPLMIVVMAEAVIDTPMIISACCTFVSGQANNDRFVTRFTFWIAI